MFEFILRRSMPAGATRRRCLPPGTTRFVCFVYIIVGTDVLGGPLKISLLNFLLIVSFLVSVVRKKKRHQKKKDRFSLFLV